MRDGTKKRILESLARRRKTLSELATELGLAPSTVYEHMQALEKVGLVRKVDEGRKWKYYELVEVREQRAPQVIRIATMIMTALFLLLTVYFGYMYYQPTGKVSVSNISEEKVGIMTAGAMNMVTSGTPEEVAEAPEVKYERYAELFGVLTLVGISLLVIEYMRRKK